MAILEQVHEGHLHIGCMFGQKSTECELQLKAQLCYHDFERVGLFRHKLAIRAETNHNEVEIYPGLIFTVADSRELLAVVSEHNLAVVGIDEVELFEPDLVEAYYTMYNDGRRITMAGLDSDFQGKPFPTTALLMAVPEIAVIKRRAVCVVCGEAATRSVRLTPSGDVAQHGEQIQVGTEEYRAVCYRHYWAAFNGALSALERSFLIRPVKTFRKPAAS